MATPRRDRTGRSSIMDTNATPPHPLPQGSTSTAATRGVSAGAFSSSSRRTPIRREQSNLFQTPEPADTSSSSSSHHLYQDVHRNHQGVMSHDTFGTYISTPVRPSSRNNPTTGRTSPTPTPTPTTAGRRLRQTPVRMQQQQQRQQQQQQQQLPEPPRTLDRRHPNVPGAFAPRSGQSSVGAASRGDDDDSLGMIPHPHSPLERFSSSMLTTPARGSRRNHGRIGGSGGSPSQTPNNSSRDIRGVPSPQTPNFHHHHHRNGGSGSGSGGSYSGSGARHSPGGPLGLSVGTISPGHRLSFGKGGDSTPGGGSISHQQQHMKVIPSPYTHSPASWQDTIPSRILVAPQQAGYQERGGGGGGGGSLSQSSNGGGSSFRQIRQDDSMDLGHSNHININNSLTSDSQEDISSLILDEKSLIFQDSDDGGGGLVSLGEMRSWRTDAMHQGLYDTAAFWGDKILAISEDENDVFWLASAYFQQQDYGRALNLLEKHEIIAMSMACQHLAARCLFEMEKYKEALDILGYENEQPEDELSEPLPQAGIKLEASMCFLRARCLVQIAYMDEAKESYKAAMRIDVKCYDAWKWMRSNHLLTAKEEREFFEELRISGQVSKKNAEFVRMCYMTKLQKETGEEHVKEQVENSKQLAKYFQEENAELLLSTAESYYASADYRDCLKVTKRILELDEYNKACIPMHVACMYELDMVNDLFLAAHHFVQKHSRFAVAWYAVAVYYYLIENYAGARTYFMRSVDMDPIFGEGWIGYGHTFAAVGSADQAIAAYNTASQKFQKLHLGSMFIGMIHLKRMNIGAATRYLVPCLELCDTDALLLNEVGVLYYHQEEFEKAIGYLEKANKRLGKAREKSLLWETNYLNLAHCYRQLRNYDKAIEYFQKGISVSKYRGQVQFDLLAGLGFVHQVRDENQEAIEYYTRAVLLRPGDEMVTEMMNKALDDDIKAAKERDAALWAATLARLPIQASGKSVAQKRLDRLTDAKTQIEVKLATRQAASALAADGGEGEEEEGGERDVLTDSSGSTRTTRADTSTGMGSAGADRNQASTVPTPSLSRAGPSSFGGAGGRSSRSGGIDDNNNHSDPFQNPPDFHFTSRSGPNSGLYSNAIWNLPDNGMAGRQTPEPQEEEEEAGDEGSDMELD